MHQRSGCRDRLHGTSVQDLLVRVAARTALVSARVVVHFARAGSGRRCNSAERWVSSWRRSSDLGRVHGIQSRRWYGRWFEGKRTSVRRTSVGEFTAPQGRDRLLQFGSPVAPSIAAAAFLLPRPDSVLAKCPSPTAAPGPAGT